MTGVSGLIGFIWVYIQAMDLGTPKSGKAEKDGHTSDLLSFMSNYT